MIGHVNLYSVSNDGKGEGGGTLLLGSSEFTQVGTRPKTAITLLTASMSLSRYTAPMIASKVALAVLGATTPAVDTFVFTKAASPIL